jgi:hypothetical protein
MPGPFPGMDPYLEAPDYWPRMHNRLITFMESALNATLPEGFAANADERLLPEEIREVFLEIQSANNPNQVIAIIEVLSPTNKTPGPHRNDYLEKQQEILHSQTHLIEIDLLRGGMRTVAAPREGLQQLGLWDYLITLHRANRRYHYDYWFKRLQESLPPISIPLMPDIPNVELNLQTVFDQAYDAGPYRRLIDYRQEPPILLTDEETAWLDARLREKGLRP